MSIYTNLFVSIDGQLLAENASLNIRMERRTENIFSIVNNYEGQDVGPFVRVVEAENFVPIAGSEFDFEKAMFDNTRVILLL